MRRRHGQDDDDLLDALIHLGTGHEPDLPRMRRRIEEQVDGHAPALPPTRRRGLTLVAAAAVVTLSVAGWVGREALFTDPNDGGVTTTTGPAGEPMTGEPSATPTTASESPSVEPTIGATATSPDASESPSKPAHHTSTNDGDTTSPTPEAQAAGPYTVAVRPVYEGLVLSAPPLADWVAVGVRVDGQQVRAKTPGFSNILEVSTPAAALATAPFTTSWLDGVPEQDRTAATWLELPSTSSVAVRVAPVEVPLTIRLHLGLRGTRALITVSSMDGPSGTATATAVGGHAFTVDISVPASHEATTIELRGTGGRGSSALFLGSVTATAG